MGGSRQRRRRLRGGRRTRSPACSSSRTKVHATKSLANERGRRRLLLRFRQRRPLAALHIAHTRPIFRISDWQHYGQANLKFTKAVLEEMAGTEQPVLLVQDYHFGLLPRLVKKARPDARVAIFWHIPWPNPETFGICPWQRELLEGLLGADLIGFHIQSHCTSFLQTVDPTLESRIYWEHFAVNRDNLS